MGADRQTTMQTIHTGKHQVHAHSRLWARTWFKKPKHAEKQPTIDQMFRKTQKYHKT